MKNIKNLLALTVGTSLGALLCFVFEGFSF